MLLSLTRDVANNYYSYAKRGQVLLAEEYTKLYPDIVTVSAHPGWT
jgi:dehydrogenase/reductase SDR family protein 12